MASQKEQEEKRREKEITHRDSTGTADSCPADSDNPSSFGDSRRYIGKLASGGEIGMVSGG